MSCALALAALLSSRAPVAELTTNSNIMVPGRSIRIADVARLSSGSALGLSSLNERVIARLPEERNSVTLSREALASLLRRTVPGLRVDTNGLSGSIRIQTAPRQAADVTRWPCYTLSRAVERDEPISAQDTSLVSCDAQRPKALIAFDRRGALARAGENLPEGAYLDRLILSPAPAANPGDRLILRSIVGHARVERDVIVVQAARPGHKLFVRDAEGQVIAASFSPLRGGRSQ